jgi:hypothetical protein
MEEAEIILNKNRIDKGSSSWVRVRFKLASLEHNNIKMACHDNVIKGLRLGRDYLVVYHA